jgi:hypothetical protein
LPESLRSGFDRFLITRGKGTQGMPDTIPKLIQHYIGDVERILANEINASTFGAD